MKKSKNKRKFYLVIDFVLSDYHINMNKEEVEEYLDDHLPNMECLGTDIVVLDQENMTTVQVSEEITTKFTLQGD